MLFVALNGLQELFAGLTVTSHYKPAVEPDEFPIRDTRPLSRLVRTDLTYVRESLTFSTTLPLQGVDMEGLEDDPTFWDMDMNAEDDEPQESALPNKSTCILAYSYSVIRLIDFHTFHAISR